MDVKDEKLDSRKLQEDIQRNIEEIPEDKPDYVPESPKSRKGDVGHAENLEEAYYSWFYIWVKKSVFRIWTKKYTWYWGYDKDCKTTTVCTQERLSCNEYADIHQEHPAWDDLNRRYVSLLFTAGGANPDCGIFHLRDDCDSFPTENGWYYCRVSFYPDFTDCVRQRYLVDGQAVVVYWPY